MEIKKPISVLIVENNFLMQYGYLSLLENSCQISIVCAGHEAIEKVKQAIVSSNPFDLILLSTELNDIAGEKVCHMIRQLEKKSNYHAHIIAISSCIEKQGEGCLFAGCDKVVNKLDRYQLISVISHWLSK